MDFTLSENKLKALMLMAAAHAPTFEEAERLVDRVIKEYKESDSITRALVDSGE